MMNLRGYLEKHLVTVDFPPTFFTTNFPVAASIFDSIALSVCSHCWSMLYLFRQLIVDWAGENPAQCTVLGLISKLGPNKT